MTVPHYMEREVKLIRDKVGWITKKLQEDAAGAQDAEGIRESHTELVGNLILLTHELTFLKSDVERSILHNEFKASMAEFIACDADEEEK